MASSSRTGRLLHRTSSSSSSSRPLTRATTLTTMLPMPTRPGIKAGILLPANNSTRRSIMLPPPRGMGMTRGRTGTTAMAAPAGGMAGMAREGRRGGRGGGCLTLGAPRPPQLVTASGARTDLDPGSLRGLEEAAGGEGYMGIGGGGGATTRLGQETEAGELEQLQEKETTQSDRRRADEEAPKLRRSLGSTIAKYFTTVRKVKDDQGTFLG